MLTAAWLVAKAFLGGLWTFLRSVPWQVWAALALALAFLVYGHVKYKDGYSTAEGHYQAEFKRLEAEREAATRYAQEAIDAHAREIAAQRLEQERALLAAEQRRLRELADLRRRLTIHVTAENTRSCPDLPRVYLLHRHDAAAYANRVERAEVAGTSAEPESEPSGVSLPALAETDIAQADAFRQAVTWGEGWRDYALTTKKSCEQTFAVLTEQKP